MKQPGRAFTLTALVLLSFSAYAGTIGEPFSASEWNPKLPEGSEGVATVGVDSIGYLYQTDGRDQSFFPALETRDRGSTRGPVLEAAGEAMVEYFPGIDDGLLFEAPQAYVGTSSELSPVRVSLGRRLEHWSHLDEQWGLGIWQPRYRWDYLHPEQVAMTGATLSYDSRDVHLVAFGSPIFIPDRGASFELQNGQFSSSSPWFVPPSPTIAPFGRSTQVNYTLAIPNVSDVVFNPGVSFLARFGRETGPWASAAYAYKPMNQLLMAADGFISVTNATPVAPVTVVPRVAYHHVGSLEAGFESERAGFSVSALVEHPDDPGAPDTMGFIQNVSPSTAVSSTFDWKFAGPAPGDGTLDVSYLRQWGGNAPDSGAMASGTASMFDSRYPFQNAVSAGVKSRVPFIDKLSGEARVLYDLGHDGETLWTTELLYRPVPRWIVGFGADIFGASDSGSSTDFIYTYRANDRVHAGVSYVF